MSFPPAFLTLLGELERYQPPPRHRLREGEIIGGKVRATLAIRSAAHGTATPPIIVGTSSAQILIEATAIGCLPVSGHLVAVVPFKKADQPPIHRCCPTKPNARTRERKKELPGTRAKRSAEAIAASAAKLREQRQARVAAVLPLVAQARAEGCVLLRDICRYLDRIAHPAPQGSRWSVGTLSTMLPRAHEKRHRDDTSVRLIAEAKSDGAASNQDVADRLNERGHRTAYDKEWTACNVSRFIRSRADCAP